jgi:hypothetical protein
VINHHHHHHHDCHCGRGRCDKKLRLLDFVTSTRHIWPAACQTDSLSEPRSAYCAQRRDGIFTALITILVVPMHPHLHRLSFLRCVGSDDPASKNKPTSISDCEHGSSSLNQMTCTSVADTNGRPVLPARPKSRFQTSRGGFISP